MNRTNPGGTLECAVVLLLLQVIGAIGLAGAFALGLLWPERRCYVAAFAFGAVLLGFCDFESNARARILFFILGSVATLILFAIATAFGFAIRVLLAKIGTVRRIRPGRLHRPGRDDDRSALLMAVLLYGVPLIVWPEEHRLGALVSSAILGVVYGSWSLQKWRRLRPICVRLRENAMLRQRSRSERTCIGCGYDLAGNTSGRCSECGKKIHPELHRHLLANGPIPRA